MDGLSKAKRSRVWRMCAQITVALCLVVFGVGDAVERTVAGHDSVLSALGYTASAGQAAGASMGHSSLHVDGASGDVDFGGVVIGHGCHVCAALPQPMRQTVASPAIHQSSPHWASVASAAGRQPLIDSPPPRA